MRSYKRIAEQLSNHEGIRKFAYRCPSGKLTIGIGRNIDSDGGLGLSEDEILYLLTNDLKRIEEELGNAFRFYKDLDPVRQDAMINMAFNLGITRLRGFRMALKLMETKEYDEASMEFLDSLWASQVGQRALDIAHMIKYGEYPDADGQR